MLPVKGHHMKETLRGITGIVNVITLEQYFYS